MGWQARREPGQLRPARAVYTRAPGRALRVAAQPHKHINTPLPCTPKFSYRISPIPHSNGLVVGSQHRRRDDVKLLCVIAHKWGGWGWWFPKNRREARQCLRCKVVQVRDIAGAPAAPHHPYGEGRAAEGSADDPAPSNGAWPSRSARTPRPTMSASEHRSHHSTARRYPSGVRGPRREG